MCTTKSAIDSTVYVASKVTNEATTQPQNVNNILDNSQSVLYLCCAAVLIVLIICITIYLLRTAEQIKTARKSVQDILTEEKKVEEKEKEEMKEDLTNIKKDIEEIKEALEKKPKE